MALYRYNSLVRVKRVQNLTQRLNPWPKFNFGGQRPLKSHNIAHSVHNAVYCTYLILNGQKFDNETIKKFYNDHQSFQFIFISILILISFRINFFNQFERARPVDLENWSLS